MTFFNIALKFLFRILSTTIPCKSRILLLEFQTTVFCPVYFFQDFVFDLICTFGLYKSCNYFLVEIVLTFVCTHILMQLSFLIWFFLKLYLKILHEILSCMFKIGTQKGYLSFFFTDNTLYTIFSPILIHFRGKKNVWTNIFCLTFIKDTKGKWFFTVL